MRRRHDIKEEEERTSMGPRLPKRNASRGSRTPCSWPVLSYDANPWSNARYSSSRRARSASANCLTRRVNWERHRMAPSRTGLVTSTDIDSRQTLSMLWASSKMTMVFTDGNCPLLGMDGVVVVVVVPTISAIRGSSKYGYVHTKMSAWDKRRRAKK